MQGNMEDVFGPLQAKFLITTRALTSLSRQSFRTAHTNAGTQYGQDWLHKSSMVGKQRIRRGSGKRFYRHAISFGSDLPGGAAVGTYGCWI